MAQHTPCQLPANVGSADVKGVELESNMLLGAGFSIDLAASWLDFQYTETDFVSDWHSGRPSSRRSRRRRRAASDCSTRRTFAGDHTFVARADWTYQSEVYGDAFNNPYNHIPSYGTGNVRLTWRGPEDKWEASAEVTERHRQALLPGDERLFGVGGFLELRARVAAHLGADGEAQLRLNRGDRRGGAMPPVFFAAKSPRSGGGFASRM